MTRIFSTFILSICTLVSFSQVYTDYVGAGHSEGMVITASDNLAGTNAENTFNAKGMDGKLFEAMRFLNQATMGASNAEAQALVDGGMDFNGWLDNQFNQPINYLTDDMQSIWTEIYNYYISIGEDPNNIFGPYSIHFNYAWWHVNMTTTDMLRQKMAMVLSEKLVISENSDIGDMALRMTDYYDLLLNNAFGNYKDLLRAVSLHPCMGYYLSHLNNPKSDPGENIHPDENYAREIMQLFSIGLYELNIDGTRKQDINGDDIPTYDNNDIKELAKVFTGLGPGDINENVTWTNDPYFGLSFYGTDVTVPMAMYESWHEPGVKTILGGITIPSGQTGMQDIDMAIDSLFEHPNVGPFISHFLIQRLIKSNPSPAYVARVATVFNDDGNGVRGDLKAVIKAIFLDDEARTGTAMLSNENGRLLPPMQRLSQFANAFDLDSPLGRFWHVGYELFDELGQHTLWSPTVFNFYLPDFQPLGDIQNADLVAPEFQIHNTATAVNWVNRVNAWTLWDYLMYTWEDNAFNPDITIITTEFMPLALESELLINAIDKRVTFGQLTDDNRTFIRNALDGLPVWTDDWNRVRLAIYLVTMSADYSITR